MTATGGTGAVAAAAGKLGPEGSSSTGTPTDGWRLQHSRPQRKARADTYWVGTNKGVDSM